MRKELMNIGKYIVVKLSTVSLVLIMILSNFSISFANGQLPIYNSIPSYDELSLSPVYAISTNKNNGSIVSRYYAVNLDDVDYFSYTNSSGSYFIIFISDQSNAVAYYNNNTSVYSLGLTVSYNGYYYNQLLGSNINSYSWETSIPSLGTFSSNNDALDYYIANGVTYPSNPSAIGDGYLTNGLPVGNVIYFDFGSSGIEYSIDLKSSFTSKSSWFGSTWVNDNRRYGFTDELPTTATNFSESSGSSIPWSPSGSSDLLGRSDEGSATLSGTSTARYLWILNPLYNLGYYDEPDKGTSLNGNIFYIGGISADTPYYIYSLKQSATSLGLSSDVASSVGGIGTVTTSGAINTVVNDGSGNQYTPSVGGDNSAPQEVSAAEGIKQTLDQFVQMFMNIFTAPISHIQQLISMGSEFFEHLAGLWSWMPTEISQFVTSCFVVLLVIGVLKLLI